MGWRGVGLRPKGSFAGSTRILCYEAFNDGFDIRSFSSIRSAGH